MFIVLYALNISSPVFNLTTLSKSTFVHWSFGVGLVGSVLAVSGGGISTTLRVITGQWIAVQSSPSVGDQVRGARS